MSREVCPYCRQRHRAPDVPILVTVTLLALLVLVAVVLGVVFG